MRLFAAGVVLGVVIGVVGVLLFTLLRPATWQEKAVKAQAQDIGCGMAVGLSVECVPVADLTRGENGGWIAIYGTARRRCYEIYVFGVPPRPRRCP